jgi:hypothetical protein
MGAERCLPDCSGTLYSTKVTTAPFRKCDGASMGLTALCTVGSEKMRGVPTSWAKGVLKDYTKNNATVGNCKMRKTYKSSRINNNRTVDCRSELKRVSPPLRIYIINETIEETLFPFFTAARLCYVGSEDLHAHRHKGPYGQV